MLIISSISNGLIDNQSIYYYLNDSIVIIEKYIVSLNY